MTHAVDPAVPMRLKWRKYRTMRRPFENRPPKVRYTNTGVRLPSDLIRRLQEIARKEKVSKNKALIELLEWAIEAYEEAKK